MNHIPCKRERRIIIFLLLFLFTPAISSAQDEHKIISDALGNLSADIPADKVFLHTDRNLYYPGDTIFFQSWVEDRFTQRFETASLSAWALLLDPSGGVTDSARFRIEHSQAPGWLVVPADAKPGWYRIEAFTSLMQNYEPSYAYSVWIRVDEMMKEKVSFDYSFDRSAYGSKDTVELILEIRDENGQELRNTSFHYKTLIGNEAGTVYRAKTGREGRSTIRIYLPDSLERKEAGLHVSLEDKAEDIRISIPLHSDYPEINFLPEGGTFVYGYRQRLAFNAVNKAGEQLFPEGLIKDDLGRIIDSLKPGPQGPGLIEITPQPGRKYYAESREYSGRRWNLPEISAGGPAIRVEQEKGNVIVDIIGQATGDTYFLALTKNYNVVAFTPLVFDRQKRIKYNIDSLPSGLARINLFSDELVPLAERSFYIPPGLKPHFNISTEYAFYLPGQETELKLEIADDQGEKLAGVFSLAVIDSALALSPPIDRQTIEDRFLFDEAFYRKVPLNIRQKGLSCLSEEELDLLLMTYDWKKYDWNNTGRGEEKKLVNYDVFNIEITHGRSEKKRSKLRNTNDPLMLLSIEDSSLVDLSGDYGNYLIDIASLSPAARSIILIPDLSVRNIIKGAQIEPLVNSPYLASFRNMNKLPEMSDEMEVNIIAEQGIGMLDSIRVIKGINVYAQRTPAKEFANEFEKRYQGLSTNTLSGQELESAMTLEDMLRRLHPSMLDLQEKKIYFRRITSYLQSSPPALFVLDGMPQETNYRYLTDIKPSDISSVTALKGFGAYYVYGEDAIGGVVFIETKAGHEGGRYDVSRQDYGQTGDLRKLIQLFRTNTSFYNPPQLVIENDPAYWIRPTLYWNPDMFYDGNKPVEVSYFNHRENGTVYIITNGVTISGDPVSGIYRYIIR
jgi:hypothetical protein